jgi:endopolyphosphatase
MLSFVLLYESKYPQVHDLSMEPTEPEFGFTKNQLHHDLRDDITRLPTNLHADDYVVVNVGPSVIPSYLPSYRIFQYNVTQYLGPKVSDHQSYTREQWEALDVLEVEDDEDDEEDDGEDIVHPPPRKRSIHSPTGIADHRLEWTTGKRKHGHRHPERPDCSLPENKEKYACRPWGPRHASSNSPSRNNTLWSLLGYAQYYLPDLAESTKKNPPRYRMEYLTFDIDALRPPETQGPEQLDGGSTVKKHVHWVPPVPKHLLPKSLREGNRTKSKFAPYQMEDLTIPSWIEFARNLGKSKQLWKQFIGFMYMGEEMEDGFDEVGPEEGFDQVLMGGRQVILQE